VRDEIGALTDQEPEDDLTQTTVMFRKNFQKADPH
jgi:hypothetical protein